MYQAREPQQSRCLVRGVELALYEWPGEGPLVVLCHATSFHARCWNRVMARLPGRKVIALDFRGHGQSAKPDPPYRWRDFGEDLAALLVSRQISNAIGAGHSMGGHALALAAAMVPNAFRSLLLLDPVILSESSYGKAQECLDFVLRRRNYWRSSEEMYQRFVDRPPFRTWDRAVLRDYCEYALNGSELACPPAVEASIYANSAAADADIHAELCNIQAAVRVVRSGKAYSYGLFEGSPTDPGLAAHVVRGTDMVLKDLSHFIPMEAPNLVAELILDSSR